MKCVSTVAVLIFVTRKTVLMENVHVKLLHHLSCWNVKSVWWMATSKIKWNLAQIEWQINALFCFSFRKIARVHAKLYTMRQMSLAKILQILKTWLSVSQGGQLWPTYYSKTNKFHTNMSSYGTNQMSLTKLLVHDRNIDMCRQDVLYLGIEKKLKNQKISNNCN